MIVLGVIEILAGVYAIASGILLARTRDSRRYAPHVIGAVILVVVLLIVSRVLMT